MEKLYQYAMANKASILSFLTVGALAAVVNFGSFSLLLKLTHLNYKIAVSFAFFLSVVFHFTANRNFTFKSRQVNFYYQLPRYLGMILMNYTVTLIVMHMAVEWVHWSPYLGNVIAIGMTVGTGYLMSKYWVFV